MQTTGREFLRAVRGERSQAAFSRWLGYRGNPVQDWEAGRRFPTASKALAACERVGIDVERALTTFHPAAARQMGARDDQGLARWLDGLRGTTPIVDIARRAGRSRYAVARWLSGAARPRVPDFFRLVDACTGRLPDLVALLVDIHLVPSLVARHEAVVAARNLASDEPWSEAVVRVLETRAAREWVHPEGALGRLLDLSPDEVARVLGRMEAAGVLVWDEGRARLGVPLTVDTAAGALERDRRRAFWLDQARRRLVSTHRRGDLFSYNLISLSRDDLRRVEERLRAAYREVRVIVAASEPVETVALFSQQLVAFDPEGHD